MKYIDIHCHLDFPDYGSDMEGIFERMAEQGVGAITIGTDLESSKKAVRIAEQNENIWACIGVHPDITPQPPLNLRGGAEQSEAGMILELRRLISSPKAMAIGECGLDFFRVPQEELQGEKKRQTELFERQIELALEHDKPLMLHCRAAYDEVLDILKSYKQKEGEKLRGDAHFFAGSVEQAKKFLDLGFAMSFTGVVTFTRDYDEVVKYLPQDSIMSETDAPFVAPVPHRGKRNEPSFVPEVVRKLAEIREEDLESFRLQLLKNADRVFGLGLQS